MPGSVQLPTDPFSFNTTDKWRGSDVSPNIIRTEVGLQRSAFQTFVLNVEMFIIIKTEQDLKTVLPPLQIGASAAVTNEFEQPAG